jgi:hypothetical protein
MRVFVVTAVLLLVLAAPGTAQVRTLAEVHTPDRGGRTAFPVIDAYGGHVVWSDYDAGAGVWRLMAHAGGVTQAVPVPPRATPFDVDLGPDGHGGTLAVYSRCARAIRHDFPTPPLDSRRYGCDLYRYSFTTGRESAIARANSGGDETWPAAWRSGLAFVRTNPGRRGPAGKVQQLLWRSLGSAGRARSLRRPSPVITVRDRSSEGTTVIRVRLPFLIEGLDLRGRTAAYTWKRVDDFDTVSFVYLATTGGDLRPAARGATFGGGAADRSRTVADATLGADGVDWLFENRGEPHYFGSFLHRATRGSVRRSPGTKAVAFARDAGTAYWIDGGPGAEFDPQSQPGGTFALRADDAVSYRSVPRGWLPIPPP